MFVNLENVGIDDYPSVVYQLSYQIELAMELAMKFGYTSDGYRVRFCSRGHVMYKCSDTEINTIEVTEI